MSPTTRRMHRGPKAGKITKQSSKKKSALRAEQIFNSKNDTTTYSAASHGLAHFPTRLPTQAAMATSTQSENILLWVSAALDEPWFSILRLTWTRILSQAKTTSVNHPYVSKENRLEAGRARLRAAREVSSSRASPHWQPLFWKLI